MRFLVEIEIDAQMLPLARSKAFEDLVVADDLLQWMMDETDRPDWVKLITSIEIL